MQGSRATVRTLAVCVFHRVRSCGVWVVCLYIAFYSEFNWQDYRRSIFEFDSLTLFCLNIHGGVRESFVYIMRYIRLIHQILFS